MSNLMNLPHELKPAFRICNRNPIILIVLLSAINGAAFSAPQQIEEPYASDVAAVTSKIKSIDQSNTDELIPLFKKPPTCSNVKNIRICHLSECDAFPGASCRADRLVLFRGEGHQSRLPSVSSLLYSYEQGMNLAPGGGIGGTLVGLKLAFEGFRTNVGYPDESDPVYFVRSDSGFDWVSQSGKILGVNPDRYWVKDSFVFMLGKLHFLDSVAYFKDTTSPSLYNTDPFVSYSSNPEVAISFAAGEEDPSTKARLIVLSVPRSEISYNCSDDLPQGGSMWDARSCGEDGPVAGYNDESEIDAIFYPKIDYVFRSYVATQQEFRRLIDNLPFEKVKFPH